jgi:dTDP-4-amino-4,6-dideoxygalactose transaminase
MREIKIPFFDLSTAYSRIADQYDDAYRRVMTSGWFILGKEVEAFEREYASYCGSEHCVGVGSGLDALFLSLKAWGIKEGDEVIVPSNTYIATWLAVSHTGAKPVPVEPDESTCNIDPELIEAAITSKTRALLPVHLYGQPADVEPITDLAGKYGLKVLQDAAQAHGATYRGKPIGGLGDAVAFSFYPSKNLGAYGDGGAVTTNDANLVEALRSLRNYGSARKYVNDIPGYNSRLDELQAAFLRVKLVHLDAWNLERKRIAHLYDAGLEGVGDLVIPRCAPGCDSVYHQYVIRTGKRDGLQQFLTDKGVGTLIHYPIPPHLQKAYAGFGLGKGSLRLAERIADTCLSLPIYPGLDDRDVHAVIGHIGDFFSM